MQGDDIGAEVWVEVGVEVGIVVVVVVGVHAKCGYRLEKQWLHNKRAFFLPFTADEANKLQVLEHDGHALVVYGGQVGVLKESHEVSLCSVLNGLDRGPLPAELAAHILRYLLHEADERRLAQEKLVRLLVLADLTESERARTVATHFLHLLLHLLACLLGMPDFGALGGVMRVANRYLLCEWHFVGRSKCGLLFIG